MIRKGFKSRGFISFIFAKRMPYGILPYNLKFQIEANQPFNLDTVVAKSVKEMV